MDSNFLELQLSDELSLVVKRGIRHYLVDFQSRISTIDNSIPEECFWLRPFDYGNSMGNLVAHMTGNIRYYIGVQLAGIDYVRDRDREFSRSCKEGRELIKRDFDDSIELFVEVLDKQTEQD